MKNQQKNKKLKNNHKMIKNKKKIQKKLKMQMKMNKMKMMRMQLEMNLIINKKFKKIFKNKSINFVFIIGFYKILIYLIGKKKQNQKIYPKV